MRNRIATLVLAAAAVAFAACSKDSTGPGASLVGTWHVAISGSTYLVRPATFDVEIQHQNNAYVGTLPTIWVIFSASDSLPFDSLSSLVVKNDSLLGAEYMRSVTCSIQLLTSLNSVKDTARGSLYYVDGGTSGCVGSATVLVTK